MDWTTLTLLLGAGLFGGAWNALAGGATLLTFPMLIALGLRPEVANATNFLALLPSNAAALPAYRRELQGIGPSIILIAVVTCLGGAAGSLLLLWSPGQTFSNLIPYLVLGATLLFWFGADVNRFLTERLPSGSAAGLIVLYVLLFCFCIYGGYFGAGLGVILLAVMTVIGFSEFHVANALKNLLATLLTIVSILIFGVGGLIAWPEACAMMAGSTAGGYLGAKYGRKVNQQILRWLLIIFGLTLSAYYFVR